MPLFGGSEDTGIEERIGEVGQLYVVTVERPIVENEDVVVEVVHADEYPIKEHSAGEGAESTDMEGIGTELEDTEGDPYWPEEEDKYWAGGSDNEDKDIHEAVDARVIVGSDNVDAAGDKESGPEACRGEDVLRQSSQILEEFGKCCL